MGTAALGCVLRERAGGKEEPWALIRGWGGAGQVLSAGRGRGWSLRSGCPDICNLKQI